MTLTLPIPPSMNRYWRSIDRGRVIISKEGREYRERVIALCRGCKRLTGPLWVRIEFYPPDKRRRDLDNLLKPLLDALAYGGVYEDDSQIDRLEISRCFDDRHKGEVLVNVQSIET